MGRAVGVVSWRVVDCGMGVRAHGLVRVCAGVGMLVVNSVRSIRAVSPWGDGSI